MEIDSGSQTRFFHFVDWRSSGGRATWQGDSTAAWVSRRGQAVPPGSAKAKYLKVITTSMLTGYLRKNGVPYGENATLTEDYDFIHEQGETNGWS